MQRYRKAAPVTTKMTSSMVNAPWPAAQAAGRTLFSTPANTSVSLYKPCRLADQDVVFPYNPGHALPPVAFRAAQAAGNEQSALDVLTAVPTVRRPIRGPHRHLRRRQRD